MIKTISVIIAYCLLASVIAAPSFSIETASSQNYTDQINSNINLEVPVNVADSLPPGLRGIEDEIGFNTGDELYAQANETKEEEFTDEDEDLDYLEDEEDTIADPIEPFNRVMFHINDKLYFWVLKPVAKGYSKILPERLRVGIRNIFTNIGAPIRVVNNLLQFKGREAFHEVVRFGLNSTYGLLGYFDVAKTNGIEMKDEDFGQTLGKWGAGPGFYITWPLLGPSSLRDTIGFAGDYFLDPINYVNPQIDRYAIKAGDKINRTSLSIGDYEEIKKDAIDPYIAIRDIYHQYRKSKIDK